MDLEDSKPPPAKKYSSKEKVGAERPDSPQLRDQNKRWTCTEIGKTIKYFLRKLFSKRQRTQQDKDVMWALQTRSWIIQMLYSIMRI